MYDSMYADQLSQYSSVIVTVGCVLIVWVVLSYILTSITLFSIGKRRETKAYGLAWVPVLQVWTLGAIADEYDQRRGEKDHKWRVVLLVLALLSVVGLVIYSISTGNSIAKFIALSESGLLETSDVDPLLVLSMFGSMFGSMFLTSVVMGLAAAGQSVCTYICLYKLFNSCKPNKPVLLLLLVAMVPFASPFVMIACKNYDNGVNCKSNQQEAIPNQAEL